MTAIVAPRPTAWRVLLTLGRVSNLPTIWTNVWAGAVLGGVHASVPALVLCVFGISLLYVGGMFLNDAFDHAVDRLERPERPIPAGWISAQAVFISGYSLLAIGLLSVALIPWFSANIYSFQATVSAGALCAAIVLYNAKHKHNPLAPWIMGLCRALVYTTSALALGGTLSTGLLACAISLGLYVVGLTFVARSENRAVLENTSSLALLFIPALTFGWLVQNEGSQNAFFLTGAVWLLWVTRCLRPLLRGQSPVMRAVVQLIAGISLLDAALAGVIAGPISLVVGVLGTGSTLLLQRLVRGT